MTSVFVRGTPRSDRDRFTICGARWLPVPKIECKHQEDPRRYTTSEHITVVGRYRGLYSYTPSYRYPVFIFVGCYLSIFVRGCYRYLVFHTLPTGLGLSHCPTSGMIVNHLNQQSWKLTHDCIHNYTYLWCNHMGYHYDTLWLKKRYAMCES